MIGDPLKDVHDVRRCNLQRANYKASLKLPNERLTFAHGSGSGCLRGLLCAQRPNCMDHGVLSAQLAAAIILGGSGHAV